MQKFGVFNSKIEDQLTTLRKELLPVYRKGDVAALAERFAEMGLIDTVQVDCENAHLDFDLDCSQDNSHDTDFANVVTLHERMKELPPAFAANPAFWAWECHNDYSDYIHYRSETMRIKYTEVDVLRDFFCRTETGTRRALVVNPLSRLWWAGRLLRDDENEEDAYHFVRIFTSSAFNSKLLLFASSTAANNHEIAMGILDALDAWKREAELADITRGEMLVCTKYLNSIGAVRMIDTLERCEICDLCLKELRDTFPI